MGNMCACIRLSEVVSSSRKGGPIESGHDQTIPAAVEGGSASGSGHRAPVVCDGRESSMPGTRSGNVKSDVEDRIENSKVHWSQLNEPESDLDDEEVAQENREVFEKLQSHPTLSGFFRTFGYDTKVWGSSGEMEVGEKFAEGGQAELFDAKVTWRNPVLNEQILERGGWVLKVFKKGSRLCKLQSQWPKGYLQWWVQNGKHDELNLGPRETKYVGEIYCGTLLEDGRFAFLMGKQHEDLRSRIDRIMLSIGEDHGPFSKDETERIMFLVAEGMHWLHSHNIVHRDLKAANVLVFQDVGYHPEYYVSDFECSIGVLGTGFFRAPEILQAIRDKSANENLEVFSKEADVYSYGMTCYEVLTGKCPFESHPIYDFDLVINGHRPCIPDHVDSWLRELLIRCWDSNCSKRPSFGEIMKILSSNSNTGREIQLYRQEWEERKIREHKERFLQ